MGVFGHGGTAARAAGRGKALGSLRPNVGEDVRVPDRRARDRGVSPIYPHRVEGTGTGDRAPVVTDERTGREEPKIRIPQRCAQPAVDPRPAVVAGNGLPSVDQLVARVITVVEPDRAE